MKFIESIKMKGVVWVWNHTPTCAEMARLASRSLEQPLTPGLRLKIALHHLICVWCKRYTAQLAFLRRATADSSEYLSGGALRAEAKDRIRLLLRTQTDA